MGIKPMAQGAHTTGLQISEDNGNTWNDFTNIHKANDSYPELSLDRLANMRDEALKTRTPVLSEEGLVVRHRVRIFNVYEQTDELSSALDQWSKTKPKY